MKKDLEKLFKLISDSFSLSKQEKKDIRDNLVAYINFHPVRNSTRERLHDKRAILLDFKLLIFLRKKIMPIALILALIFGGGGVSYAAESAVPGDVLYPIKVSVNEEVRGFATFSPEGKAEWESRRLERRLEEAEELASEDVLDAEKQKEIEDRIEKHALKVEAHIARIEDRNNIARAAEVSSNLETTLRAHKDVFESISQKRRAAKLASVATKDGETTDTDGGGDISTEDRYNKFAEKIEARAVKLSEINETHLKTLAFEDAPGRKVAAESMKKSAEKHLETLIHLFEERKENIDDVSMLSRIEEGILKVRELIAEGDRLFAEEEYGNALIKFQEARAFAVKLTVFLKSQIKHDVSVDERKITHDKIKAVRIDAKGGVKVAPYDREFEEEDRKEAAAKLLREANETLEEVKELFAKKESELSDDVRRRVRKTIAQAEELIEKGKRAFEAEEYGTAYLSARKAIRALKNAEIIIRKDLATDDPDDGNIVEVEDRVEIITPIRTRRAPAPTPINTRVAPIPTPTQLFVPAPTTGSVDSDVIEENKDDSLSTQGVRAIKTIQEVFKLENNSEIDEAKLEVRSTGY